jgi:regulator of replication initiation timing
VTKVETTLVFNQRLNTKGGFVSVSKMVPVLNQVTNTVFDMKNMIHNMSSEIKKIHKIPSQVGENHLKATENAYGIKVFGKLEAFESYAISKAKKKKTKKI